MIRLPVVVAGALVLAVVESHPVTNSPEPTPAFAAPWAIIAYGPPLKKQVILADGRENLRFMLAAAGTAVETPPDRMRGRPYVELALFWGPEWAHLAKSSEAVAQLKPEQANQRGRFFPAYRDAPAAVMLFAPTVSPVSQALWVRPVEPDGLAVLATNGIPVRVAR